MSNDSKKYIVDNKGNNYGKNKAKLKEYSLMIEIKTKVKLTAEEVREAVEDYCGIEVTEIQTLINWS
jgi:flagellar biosynthesis chaperone FliJ